jgi:hypothetical protein
MRSIKIHPSDKPWINPEIKDLINKRQRLKNLARKSIMA